LRPEPWRFARETSLVSSNEERIMCKSAMGMTRISGRTVGRVWHAGPKNAWWSQHREASLNWLALGLLLAAWNASDNDSARALRRPEALRGYASVSVRAPRGASTG